TLDSVGTNNGTPIGGISYTAGEVGQAFVFNGTSSYVTVQASPSLNVGANGSGITIECWEKPSYANSADQYLPIVKWNSPSLAGVHLGNEGQNTLFANIVDTANNNHA